MICKKGRKNNYFSWTCYESSTEPGTLFTISNLTLCSWHFCTACHAADTYPRLLSSYCSFSSPFYRWGTLRSVMREAQKGIGDLWCGLSVVTSKEFSVDRGVTENQLAQADINSDVTLIAYTFDVTWWKWHFSLWSSSPKPIIPVKSWKKKSQRSPNWGTFYEAPDQKSSKLSRSLKKEKCKKLPQSREA